MRPAPVLGLVLLAGCALPDLGLPDDPAASRGAYPALAPIEQVLGAAEQPDRITGAETSALSARAARLRARAAGMRPSALDAAERTRIRAGIARPAARP